MIDTQPIPTPETIAPQVGQIFTIEGHTGKFPTCIVINTNTGNPTTVETLGVVNRTPGEERLSLNVARQDILRLSPTGESWPLQTIRTAIARQQREGLGMSFVNEFASYALRLLPREV